jgi:hypothetical protein
LKSFVVPAGALPLPVSDKAIGKASRAINRQICSAEAVRMPSQAGSTTASHQPWSPPTAMQQSCESLRVGLARRDRKWSSNDGQIPNVRDVRVALSTRATIVSRGIGGRRENGLVSDLPPPKPLTLRFATFVIAVWRGALCAAVCAREQDSPGWYSMIGSPQANRSDDIVSLSPRTREGGHHPRRMHELLGGILSLTGAAGAHHACRMNDLLGGIMTHKLRGEDALRDR